MSSPQGFHRDAYQREFTAQVLECAPSESAWRARLADTCFYPDSGGQPADRGSIGGVAVLDVQIENGGITHLLAAPLAAGNHAAVIDWPRRYDHMQQHTAQHLLTATLFELFSAETVSFHLGDTLSSIDITLPAINAEQIARAEKRCAERIAAALPVTARWISAAEFRGMELRKKALPEHVEEDIRLVTIDGVDTVHCGGTHVRGTAELHAVKIVGTEKVRETTRLSFLAGDRALNDYAAKHDMTASLAAALTCAIPELPAIVGKLREENRETASRLKRLGRELAGLRANADLALARAVGGRKILVRRYEDLDPAALKSLAGEMTAAEPALLFCGAVIHEGRTHVVCAGGASFSGDIGPALQRLLPLINGRGGGRGNFAQGAGDAAGIETLLQTAETVLPEL